VGGGEGVKLAESERVGGHREPLNDSASGGDDRGGVRVAVVSTPMTKSTLSASMGAMVLSTFVGVHRVGTGLDGITVRQDCDEARP
jgi:hypothetical protein